MNSKSTVSTSHPTPARSGRLTDVEIAERWLSSQKDKLAFSAAPGEKGEWYHYRAIPDGKRVLRWLSDSHIEANILTFLCTLNAAGENIKISPAKVRAIRQLGAMLEIGGRDK